MNTIRFDEIVEVKSLSEFMIKGREWFTYHNDISNSIKVVDKIVGAALSGSVISEKTARMFLESISDKQLDAVINNTISYLKKLNIQIPINKRGDK